MDSGFIFRTQFKVLPGNEGTFIVQYGYDEPGMVGCMWGFSNLDDLLQFLRDSAIAVKANSSKDRPA